MTERRSIAKTFEREPIWTEMEVGYVSQRAVPDWREAARIFEESIGQPDGWLSDEDGLDECHLRWVEGEAERARIAAEHGIAVDADEDYFQECKADEGEPFWKVEA